MASAVIRPHEKLRYARGPNSNGRPSTRLYVRAVTNRSSPRDRPRGVMRMRYQRSSSVSSRTTSRSVAVSTRTCSGQERALSSTVPPPSVVTVPPITVADPTRPAPRTTRLPLMTTTLPLTRPAMTTCPPRTATSPSMTSDAATVRSPVTRRDVVALKTSCTSSAMSRGTARRSRISRTGGPVCWAGRAATQQRSRTVVIRWRMKTEKRKIQVLRSPTLRQRRTLRLRHAHRRVAGNAEPLHAAIEIGPVRLQPPSCFSDVAVRHRQRPGDEQTFVFIQQLSERLFRLHGIRKIGLFCRRRAVHREHLRYLTRRDPLARVEDHESFHDVRQLPDVAGPRVALQHRDRFR